VYLLSVLVTYLTVGLIFYNLAYYFQRIALAAYLNKIVGILVMTMALFQLKEVFLPGSRFRLGPPKWASKKMIDLMERISIPVAVLLGFLTTAMGTPCMLPLYLGTVTVLVNSGLASSEVMVKFLYYNLVLILPMMVVFVVMVKGKRVVGIKEWEHRTEKWWRLLLGVAMLFVSIWLIKQ